MIRILLSLWPVVLPILVYVVWLLAARRKARKAGDEVLPGIKDGPWVWTVIASLLIAAGCFIYMALGAETYRHYTPAHMENGTLVRGEGAR